MAEVFDVFISYRREDGSEIAENLYTYLVKKGLRVFWDKEKLENGNYFDTQLKERIIATPHYVLIGTSKAFARRDGDDWVWKEIKLAHSGFDKNPKEHSFDIMLAPGTETSDDLPEWFARIQRIEMQHKNDENAFEKVLRNVTKLNRVNLWYSAHRWLENSKKQGGRFAQLRVDQSILPNVEPTRSIDDLPVDVRLDCESKEAKPLLDAIRETEGHLFLIGEGGIGKTTALVHIMESAYGEGKQYRKDVQIPIFVELSFAPDADSASTLYQKGTSTFIRRSVYKQIIDRRDGDGGVFTESGELDEVFKLDPSIAVKPINDLFSQESPVPEYLLLLDGLNEVSTAKIKGSTETVLDLVRSEIRTITESFPNVRVILTSRTDESATAISSGVTRIYLTGVNDENVKGFLQNSGVSFEKINEATSNRDLLETLRIPLFLTMYASLKDADEIFTQGEILRTFFHERRENVYTMQNRTAKVGDSFFASENAVEDARLNADMQLFVLDFILPQIAYEMQSNELFYCSLSALREWIIPVLTGKKDTDVCGLYGDVFSVKSRVGGEKHPEDIADEIIKVFTNNERRIASAVAETLVSSFGIMQKTNDEFGFVHQHIRDYFAAVKYIQIMKLATALMKDKQEDDALALMNEYFREHPVVLRVRKFIGESLGEYHNKPKCVDRKWIYTEPKKRCDRNLISHALEIYRKKKREETGYGVYNLIHILNEVRDDLSGCDFSGIDFSRCSLNGMRLSRIDLPARFDGAHLDGDELLFYGHPYYVRFAFFFPDGERIISGDFNGYIRIWDAESLECIGSLEPYCYTVRSITAGISPDGKTIVLMAEDENPVLYDTDSLEYLDELTGQEESKGSVGFTPDGKKIVLASGGHATIWDAQTKQLLGSIGTDDGYSGTVHFSPDGTRVITACDGKAIIWDADTLQMLQTLEGIGDSVSSARYSPDGKRIVTVSNDGITIWNAETLQIVDKIMDTQDVHFSPDGKRLVTKYHTIWDIGTKRLLKPLIEGFHRELEYFSPYPPFFNRDGDRTVTVLAESLFVWNAISMEKIGQINCTEKGVSSAVFSQDGKKILVATNEKTAQIWDARSLRLLGTTDKHGLNTWLPEFSGKAEFSPNGNRFIAFDGISDYASVWDTESLQLIGTIRGSDGERISSAHFNPTGDKIVTTSDGNTTIVSDASTLQILGSFEGAPSTNYARFSPDGKRIITTSSSVVPPEIWSAETYEWLGALCEAGRDSYICFAQFSPDGSRIVTASRVGRVAVWDAQSLQLLVVTQENGHIADNAFAYYSPDGTKIIAKMERDVVIRDADTLHLLDILGPSVDAHFSPDGSKFVTASNMIEIADARTKMVNSIPSVPGLIFAGVDFRNLDEESVFTEEGKETIRTYGGLI